MTRRTASNSRRFLSPIAPSSDDSAGWGTVLAIAGAAAGIFVLVKANREEEKLVRRVLPKLPEVPWWATAPLMPFVPGLAPAAIARAVVSRKARMDQSDLYTQVQTRLNALGYAVPVTGANDSATHAAVTAFQRARGLHIDGTVGPETLGALGIVAPTPTILPRKSYQPSMDEAAQALATAFRRVRPRSRAPWKRADGIARVSVGYGARMASHSRHVRSNPGQTMAFGTARSQHCNWRRRDQGNFWVSKLCRSSGRP